MTKKVQPKKVVNALTGRDKIVKAKAVKVKGKGGK